MVRGYARVLEEMIRKHPSQWIRYTPLDEGPCNETGGSDTGV